MTRKMKIKPVPSRIKEIKSTEDYEGVESSGEHKTGESELEEEIWQAENEQFRDFISTGSMRAPVLETGQENDSNVSLSDVQEIERTQDSKSEGARSVYETGTSKFTENDRPKYNPATFREQTILRDESSMLGNSPSQRPTGGISFRDPELEMFGSNKKDEYEEKIKPEDAKAKRKMPWEA